MTSAVGYALGAMVLYGIGDFVFKLGSTGPYRTHHFVLAQSLASFTVILLYALVTGGLQPGWVALWGVAAGVFIFLGFNSFAHSLRHGNVSINAPIFRLNFIVTAMLSVLLLGERLTMVKIGGLALALLAVWLLLGAAGAQGAVDRHQLRRSLTLAVLATLALGTGNVLHKVGLGAGGVAATLLCAHSGTYLMLATTTAARSEGGLAIPSAVWPYALTGACVMMTAFVLMLQALARAEASVVVPIAQMGLVVSAPLGVAVLGEALTARKMAGVGAAVAALALLALA